jgi:hypothetical protein
VIAAALIGSAAARIKSNFFIMVGLLSAIIGKVSKLSGVMQIPGVFQCTFKNLM